MCCLDYGMYIQTLYIHKAEVLLPPPFEWETTAFNSVYLIMRKFEFLFEIVIYSKVR